VWRAKRELASASVAHWLTRSGDAQVGVCRFAELDADGAEGPAWLPVRAEHTIATAAAVGPRGWACHARRCRFAVGAVAVWNDRPADRRFDAVLTASGDLAPSQKVELILVTADDLGELPESSGADGLRTGHDLAAERDDSSPAPRNTTGERSPPR